jgi:hypothetical protein
MTSTLTVTNSFTFTHTGTITPVDTGTPSATFTITDTPTPPSITVMVGSNPPVNNTQQPGSTDVPVLQIMLVNPNAIPVTLTSLVLTASGTGNDLTGIDAVKVYLDNNEDGVVDPMDSPLGSGVYFGDNGTATIILDNAIDPASMETLLVVYDLSTAAGNGTYLAILNAGGLIVDQVNGPVVINGLPQTGAIISILHPTDTPTSVFTPIPSATPTATPTRSWTPVPTYTRTTTPQPTNTGIPTATRTEIPSFTPTTTATASVTRTFTHTSTITLTVTATEQPGVDKPVIYPNPSDGTQPVSIHIPGRTGTADITVQIFTVAFRLVQQQIFPEEPLGADVKIDLKDKNGKPLASGLYYVVVSIDGKKTVGKLLLMR